MNTLIPGAPLRSLSPTSNEYQRAQGVSRAAKPARAARFTLDAPEHSGTIPGAIGDILPPGVALTSNLAVIFTLNQYKMIHVLGIKRGVWAMVEHKTEFIAELRKLYQRGAGKWADHDTNWYTHLLQHPELAEDLNKKWWKSVLDFRSKAGQNPD